VGVDRQARAERMGAEAKHREFIEGLGAQGWKTRYKPSTPQLCETVGQEIPLTCQSVPPVLVYIHMT
jgi:hypothetical protein